MRISDWSSDVCSSDRQPFADALGTLSRWEHLPRAITPSEGSLAILVARLLADEARRLRQRGEERLGSEADLTERIGVSRQVLRQAVQMLEARGVLICRRGRSRGVEIRTDTEPGAIRAEERRVGKEGVRGGE